ncbi:enamine deaminase RidA [Mycolicibacterium agri]|uniref:Enamine deaminase RidA n=1 Tax=Mycolicibacterium agri TaxID=36811 RepID=A0A2A7N1Y3_MYCAG|nr:Rid family hydrolase [Mycolicibacterium agri]PEG37809.1 enamine deaminase RidA [Mycolicibacterium agri]GFG54894.1 enamine deaminase RidA [Mycolicibacterium agri]
MTTFDRIMTGVGAHIAPIYADAVSVPAGGRTVFVSGTPGLRENGTVPEDFIEEARQCWANVEAALEKAGAKLTDIVYMRQWLTRRDDLSAYMTVNRELIQHDPAAMLCIIEGLVWPEIHLEVEAIAVIPE